MTDSEPLRGFMDRDWTAGDVGAVDEHRASTDTILARTGRVGFRTRPASVNAWRQ
jgi:hypothetical protein